MVELETRTETVENVLAFGRNEVVPTIEIPNSLAVYVFAVVAISSVAPAVYPESGLVRNFFVRYL